MIHKQIINKQMYKPLCCDSVANVMCFGAKGDGEHDDAPAIQRAIESFSDTSSQHGISNAGGFVWLPKPPEYYCIESPIAVNVPNIIIAGYSNPSIDNPSVCLMNKYHGAVFTFPVDVSQVSPFTASGFSIKSLSCVPVVGSCGFEIFTGQKVNGFRKEFHFENIGIYYQETGIAVKYGVSGDYTQAGMFRVYNCEIKRNGYAIRTMSPTSINCVSLVDSYLAQNCKGEVDERLASVDMRIFGARIDACCFEGQPRGIRLYRSNGVNFRACYGENNEDYLIKCDGTNIVADNSNFYCCGANDNGQKKYIVQNGI